MNTLNINDAIARIKQQAQEALADRLLNVDQVNLARCLLSSVGCFDVRLPQHLDEADGFTLCVKENELPSVEDALGCPLNMDESSVDDARLRTIKVRLVPADFPSVKIVYVTKAPRQRKGQPPPQPRNRNLGIRLTDDEHRLIRAAACTQEISVEAFVSKAVLKAAEGVKGGDEDADPLGLLAGVRNGRPGYGKCGIEFAKWLKKKPNQPALEELRQKLQIVDRGVRTLQREKFAAFFQWCSKHFPELLERIPRKRQTSFADGFFSELPKLLAKQHFSKVT